jgi:hypothetical protein
MKNIDDKEIMEPYKFYEMNKFTFFYLLDDGDGLIFGNSRSPSRGPVGSSKYELANMKNIFDILKDREKHFIWFIFESGAI